MSKMTLQIIASAENRASGPLGQVQNSMKKTGQSVKKAVDDLTRFNQVMFTTSAFVGFFGTMFRNLSTNIEEGAKLDRLEDQYERVLGPSGQLFKSISIFTDVSIDKMEALRAGLAMKSLGIYSNTSQVAEAIARAGVAAKQAGLESGEGIKHFTEFLKDSNVSHLEHLNLLKSSDASFKLHMAVIGKYTGVMGSALSAQERLSIGMTLLKRATASQMLGFRDLLDVVLDVKQNFAFLMKEIGSTVGTALIPLLETFIDISWSVRDVLRHLKQTDQGFLFLVKSVLGVTTAMTGMIAAFGTTRLLLKGLTALGFGFPTLALVLSSVGVLFGLVSSNVKTFDDELKNSSIGRFGEKLKVFGAVLRGVYELTSSFFKEENLSKGIGEISHSVKQLLEKNGLLGFVTNISKIAIIITNFAIKTGKVLSTFFDQTIEGFNAIYSILTRFSNKETSILPKWLLDSKIVDNLAKVAAIMGIGLGTAAMTGKGRGVLSKIPILGKFLGGAGPKGTASDPIFTKSTDIPGMGKTSSMLGNISGTLGRSVLAFYGVANIVGMFEGIADGLEKNSERLSLAFSQISDYLQIKMKLMSDYISDNYKGTVDYLSSSFKKISDFLTENFKFLGFLFKDIASFMVHPIDTSKKSWYETTNALSTKLALAGQSSANDAAMSNIERFKNMGKVDYIPETAKGRQDFLINSMTAYGTAKNDSMVNSLSQAIGKAMGIESPGGTEITREEFVQVLSEATKRGLENSAVAKHIEKTAKSNEKMSNEPKMDVAKQRGGC